MKRFEKTLVEHISTRDAALLDALDNNAPLDEVDSRLKAAADAVLAQFTDTTSGDDVFAASAAERAAEKAAGEGEMRARQAPENTSA